MYFPDISIAIGMTSVQSVNMPVLQISRIQQEHDENETNLKYKHGEQLKYANLQAENELREVINSLN